MPPAKTNRLLHGRSAAGNNFLVVCSVQDIGGLQSVSKKNVTSLPSTSALLLQFSATIAAPCSAFSDKYEDCVGCATVIAISWSINIQWDCRASRGTISLTGTGDAATNGQRTFSSVAELHIESNDHHQEVELEESSISRNYFTRSLGLLDLQTSVVVHKSFGYFLIDQLMTPPTDESPIAFRWTSIYPNYKTGTMSTYAPRVNLYVFCS